MSTPDSAIIQHILTGDTARFNTLVTRHLRAVYAVAYAQRPNHADAEDITQEAFLKAYESLDTLRDTGRFEGWVTTIARNLAKRPGRHYGKEISLDDTDLPDPRLISQATKEEIHSILRASVDQLDEHSRETLLLHYFAGKSTQEIADLTEITQAAVLKRLQRGRERLGEHLLSQYHDTFAPEDSLDKRKQTITKAVALTTPAWALEATVASTAAGSLIATAMKLIIAASIGATAFIIASLVLMEKESPLDARETSTEIEPPIEQTSPSITEPPQALESTLLALADPVPSVAESAPDDAPESTKPFELDVLSSAVFSDIHIANLLEVIKSNYLEDTPFFIDLNAVGKPFDTDSPNPPTVPDTGLPAYQYITDGMIEYVNMKNITMVQVLTAMCVPLGLQVVSEPGFIWISSPELIAQESKWEPESRFDAYDNEDRLSEIANITFENIHLKNLVEILSDDYEITIAWDYGIIEPHKVPEFLPISYFPAETTTDGRIAYLNLKNIQLRDALKATLRPLGLSYVIQGSYIWISTPQRIESETEAQMYYSPEKLKKTREFNEERLQQPVGIVFEDIYIKDLFEVLTSNYEINFVIDQRVMTPDEYSDDDYARYYGPPQPISPCDQCTPKSDGMIRDINLTQVMLPEIFDIIARQLNLAYSIDNGQVIFSTPERIQSSTIPKEDLIPVETFAEQLK